MVQKSLICFYLLLSLFFAHLLSLSPSGYVPPLYLNSFIFSYEVFFFWRFWKGVGLEWIYIVGRGGLVGDMQFRSTMAVFFFFNYFFSVSFKGYDITISSLFILFCFILFFFLVLLDFFSIFGIFWGAEGGVKGGWRGECVCYYFLYIYFTVFFFFYFESSHHDP